MSQANVLRLVQRELRLHEDGTDYGVPTQDVLVFVMQDELRRGEPITLAALRRGSTR